MKKITVALIIAAITLSFAATAAAASDFGSGVAVVAEDIKLIKTGLLGRKISFSDADFKQGLCINDFKKITVTKLPPTSEGTLMLAGRRVGEGAEIKRKNLPSLVFIPTSKEIAESSFSFKIDGYASDEEIDFILKFTDKVNYEPKIQSEDNKSLTVSTQRDIGIHGAVSATDTEGDAIRYMIVSYPQSGLLSSFNKDTGEYVYTPNSSFTGKDSFIYVAQDEWGNFSKTATVNITVTERMSEVKYVDMLERPEYNAAVAMTAMGIMGGKVIGDGVYFSPDETVTRAEFVAMAMKAAGIRADSTLSSTYFDDNKKIPEPLLGYVATAQRIGIISGEFKNGELIFSPNDAITKYDAAVILANIIGEDLNDDAPVLSFSGEDRIPCWAKNSVYAMCAAGIFEHDGNTVDASSPVTRADAARYLYKILEII
ncbi:MAG: hypothetical protein E7612_05795 [Ruminococcaceae bacterium]|nr:hypothetical protein [Oscillospiraceae bacterium]